MRPLSGSAINMTLFLPFLLAHLLADFPFQPRVLVQYKMESPWGVFIHGLIHFLCYLLLAFPFLNHDPVLYAALMLFGAHMVIDFVKISAQKRLLHVGTFVFYVADQLLHLAVIGGAAAFLYLSPLEPGLLRPWVSVYGMTSVWVYLIALVFFTYFYEVTLWTYRDGRHALLGRYRYSSMLKNALLVTAGFAVYWLAF